MLWPLKQDGFQTLESNGGPVIRIRLLAAVAVTGLSAAYAHAAAPARYVTGADQTYVHRISLIDADGNVIGPHSTVPYSPSRTCAKCHDVERIAMGRHFQAGFGGIADGRPGEPWILWDAATGTQVPLSHREWAIGAKRQPSDFGMTDWEFALLFGRHHPGGGMLQWQKDGRRRDVFEENFLHKGPAVAQGIPAPRWKEVGALEIDCLACHANSGYSNGNRWYYIHTELDFRGAPTAAAGFGTIRTSVKDQMRLEGYLSDTPHWSPYLAKDPGVRYDPARFDPDGRVFIDITRRPPARNCQVCHASRVPGVVDKGAPEHDLDVHIAAGMACTDCHRNGIDHEILRGDGGGEGHTFHPGGDTLTCRGCHESGRLGAPSVEHYGLPAFHLEKLACTVCHAGPLPEREVGLFQTARANALGLKTFLNLDAVRRPAVQAPVFQRDRDGVIRPHAAIWPAWFGMRKDKEIVPVPLQRVREAIAAVRPLALARQAEEIRKNGEAAWVKAEQAKGRTPPKEEVEVAGRNAVIVWQESQGKEREQALAVALEKARERLDAQAKAEGRRVVEEEVRNALDAARVELDLRAETEQLKRELPAILRYLAAKDKAEEVSEETMKAVADGSFGASPYVYLAGGRLYQADGTVVDNVPEAAPVTWPIAHTVRGAGEALGAKGCSDCHALRSPFFFGLVKAEPTGPGGDRMEIKQCTLMGLSSKAIRVGALAVMARELFMKKIWFFGLLGLLVFALAHYLIVELRGPLAVASGAAPPAFRMIWSGFSWIGFTSIALCAILCATGAGFLATYGPSPILEIFTARGTVKLHLVGGFVFTILCVFLTVRFLLRVLRDPAARNAAGGLLWEVRAEDEVSILSRTRCFGCWVWLDILCCAALACTGFILAARIPPVGSTIHLLERLVEHRFIGPMAYAIHGAAGSLMIVRLLGHLYARFVLHKRRG